jgi:nitrite reductase/ring-hydroxylating ferredoxin subunit
MKSSDNINPDAHADCNGCPLIPERREFLRNAGALALGLLSLSLPIRSVSAKVLTSAVGGRKTLSYPVPAADGVDMNEVFAFSLGCPHQNVSLRWNETDMRFQCPKHHSQYQPSGEFITGRATRNMDRLAIRRDAANNIVVDPDTLYKSDEDEAQWKNAVVKL